MNRPITTGLIGNGPHARALLEHDAPLGRIHLAALAPAPGENDAPQTPARDWRALAADPAIPAILALGPESSRLEVVTTALAAGKIVLCPPGSGPIAASTGRLITGGEIAHSESGRRGLAAIADPAFGALHSLYIAIRQPRGPSPGAGDVLDDLAPEAIDFALAAIPDPITQVRVNAGRLFGPDRDSAVILLRSATNVVVTIELARCLPPSLPAPGLGEIDIDAMGAHQSVRITPLASAVRIHRDDGIALKPWLNPPVLDMLHAVAAAIDDPTTANDGIAGANRTAALLARIRAAAS